VKDSSGQKLAVRYEEEPERRSTARKFLLAVGNPETENEKTDNGD